MAVLHETFLSLGGTEYTANLRQHDIPLNYEKIENSVMGTGVPTVELGLFNTSISATLKYSAALELALANSWASDSSIAVIVRRHPGAASAVNFSISFTGAVESFGAIMGSVGTLHEMAVSIRTNSDLTYAEA